MKFKITILCLIFFIGTIFKQSIAQDLIATGKVTNKTTGESFVGATVNVLGTTNLTVTDANGNFSISIPKGGKLIFSFTGFTPVNLIVNRVGPFVILMEETSKVLDEVVVIGYGTQKITKISGAISSVKSADIQKLKPVRVEEALQGAAGVNVVQSGSPGAKPFITIRGIPSYKGNGPLVVVDGVPQTQDDLNSINPADIDNISVLKDAATAAIYGVSGGNGVLIVTTKGGRKNQKTEFNLNSTYAVQEVTNTVPVLNASEYAAIINEGSTVSGGNIVFPNLSLLGKGTDWQKEIFKKAPLQSHSITAKGGSDKMTYFLSGAYLSQGGIVGGYDKSKFNRINCSLS